MYTYWNDVLCDLVVWKNMLILTFAFFSCSIAALEGAVESLSSGGAIELSLIHPQLTLLRDYDQPLERYDDYEDDDGELRAESSLAEKFGEFSLSAIINSLSLTRNLHLITRPLWSV